MCASVGTCVIPVSQISNLETLVWKIGAWGELYVIYCALKCGGQTLGFSYSI